MKHYISTFIFVVCKLSTEVKVMELYTTSILLLKFEAQHCALHRFMEQDLASVDRSITPWVVVAGHRPMYLSIEKDYFSSGYYHVSLELQAQLEDLLVMHKVIL